MWDNTRQKTWTLCVWVRCIQHNIQLRGCHLCRPMSGISIHSMTLFPDSPQLLLSWWLGDPCCVQAQSGSDWATEIHRSSVSSRQLNGKRQTEEKKTTLQRLYSKNDRLLGWRFRYKVSLLWWYVCVCDCFCKKKKKKPKRFHTQGRMV